MNRPAFRRKMRRGLITGALGVCLLLILPHLRWWQAPAPAWPADASLPALGQSCTASEAARRAGWRYRVRAQITSNREREALEEWDPAALMGMDDERCRRQQLAADRTGDLRRARAAAQRAAALARTRDERYRATLLRVFLAHDTGRHAEELRLARALVALAPRDLDSLSCLQRALWSDRE